MGGGTAFSRRLAGARPHRRAVGVQGEDDTSGLHWTAQGTSTTTLPSRIGISRAGRASGACVSPIGSAPLIGEKRGSGGRCDPPPSSYRSLSPSLFQERRGAV